jgi:tellurite resistance protein
LCVILATAAAFLVTFSAAASDITTLDGRTYKDARVTGVDPDGIRVTHSYGVTKIPFGQLRESLRKKYARQQRTAAPTTTVPAATATPMPANSPVIILSPVPVARPPNEPSTAATPSSTPANPPNGRSLRAGESEHRSSDETTVFVIVLFVLTGIVVAAAVAVGVALKGRAGELRRKETRENRSPERDQFVARSAVVPQRSFADEPTVGGIGISLSFGTATTPRPPIAKRKVKLTWLGPDQPLTHAGVVIPSAMTYVAERSLPWPGEPSLIVTSLSVSATAAHALQDFGYYPAYDRVTAEQRRSYLQWLAGGRTDPDPTQRSLGHLFMFFYGLERRILVEHDRDVRLLEELVRLLQEYGPAHRSRSLRTYFLQLLHFGGWQLGAEAYRALWPRLVELAGDRPDEDALRFVLANLHQRAEPLDWTIAFRLALASRESRRSTVMARAEEKFFALFQKRYEDEFGGNFVPDAAKQQTIAQYRPASSALLQLRYERQYAEALELRLPNVTGLHGQFKRLPAIWNSCVDDLSGYSRALGSVRAGSGAALARWHALPAELRTTEEHPLKAAFETLIGNAPKEGDYTFVPTAALASLAEIPERAKLTAVQSRQLLEVVSELGWELAPNPEVTGLSLAWNQELAIFRTNKADQRTAHTAGLVRLLYLAVALAASDGAIEEEEVVTFYQIISTESANESDLLLLRATEASLRRDANVAIRSLPQLAKLIPSESKGFVLRIMARIAASDSEVSLDELKVLRRIARAFGLNADAIETLLREDESFREVTIATVERSGARGEAIPARPSQERRAFALDENRIRALTQETREVISLLSSVMTDADEAPCSPPQPVEAAAHAARAEWLAGLDARYHTAVLSLVTRDEIPTADFDCVAADNHLMPDDLFNAVNTWSDEVLGDFLLERGENVTIFRSLLPEAAAVQAAA